MKAVAYMLDTTAWKEFKDPNAKNESGCHVNNDNGKRQDRLLFSMLDSNSTIIYITTIKWNNCNVGCWFI